MNNLQTKTAEQAVIKVEHNISRGKADALGVHEWPIWMKEVSEFKWNYDSEETCFFLEGEVVVTPDGGAPVRMGEGDLAVFPKGLSCTWKVILPVRKHYKFE